MAIQKKSIFQVIIFFVFFVLGYLAYGYFLKSDDSSTTNAGDVSEELQQKQQLTDVNSTLGTKWQWDASGDEPQQNQKKAEPKQMSQQYPFTKQSVYNALQAVKLDANGRLILDNDAMIALDEALERIYNELSPEALAALQQLIKEALPGITGEQTAELVANYTNYLKAKEDFSELYENQDESAGEMTQESIANDAQLYDELQALRAVHLGDEAATELFRVSDAAAEYMFASMQLSMNSNMTPEEMVQEQQRLQDKQIADSLNIVNWDSRYSSFKANKQSILNASISQAEKEKQITELIQQQFSAQEIEKMRYFGLDQAY
ncbi:hypothetical protein ISG33_08880 [Glaciecola sp. MH2013]|uniref:hypothetical protein n=1 Tax=Glaciecola sp. MH2013 TaxID=2785524 RepID=UPI00189F1C28|nr:hypothetical protein [Glaciecola sp. MH2013]MBF7073507.1 hypothetical protein [Glaciecola sp. MH2013]